MNHTSIKTSASTAIAAALVLIGAAAHAGPADPTNITGSTIRGTGIASAILARGVSGSDTSANGQVGIGPVDLGGGYSKRTGTLVTDVGIGRVDINGGSTVSGSTVEANGTASNVDVSGATVHVGAVRIGGK